MPTTPELSAPQEILRVAIVFLVLVGALAVMSGLGVLKRRGKATTVKPSRRHLALGVALLLGAAIATGFRRDPVPEAEVITAQRFLSRRLPALSIEAPPPWQFEHDVEMGRLTGQRPGGRMMIETTFITDATDSGSALNGI